MASLPDCPIVHIVATGVANLASVQACLKRLGARPVLTESRLQVAAAAHLVLPGVGAFGAAMRQLETSGLAQPLRERIAAGRPTLAICLGMQLLFEESDESPGVRGLSALPGRIARLPQGDAAARLPHMGWNRVTPNSGCTMLAAGEASFANSYCLLEAPEGAAAATTQHGNTTFVSAFERGGLLACQFHPELSGAWGSELVRRWLTTTGASIPTGATASPDLESASC